jgi:hypothetical protein
VTDMDREEITDERIVVIEEDDEDGRSPIVMWIALVVLCLGMFAAGFLVGVISDGNAEILHDFEKKAVTKPYAATTPEGGTTAVEGAAPPKIGTSPATPTATSARPANGRTQWFMQMRQGTDMHPVEMRNADLDDDAMVDVLGAYGAQTLPVARIVVGAGGVARISLPEGRYTLQTTSVPLSGLENGPPRMVEGVLTVGDGPPRSQPSAAADRTGSWRIIASEQPKPRELIPSVRARPSGQDREYEGLGRSAETGGSPTYSPGT